MGEIRHVYTNAVADGTATSVVRPSDWNSMHLYTMQDGVSLGGNTAGVLTGINSGTLFLAGGNNITLSQNANSVTVSAGASGAASSATVSDAAGSGTIARLAFTNLNGITLSLSTGAAGLHTIVGSHNALTTAMASNRGSDFVQATAAFAGTNASGTIASSGVSVSVGNYLTTAMASNRASDFVQATAAFNGTNASGTIASGAISVSVAAAIAQTNQSVGLYASSNTYLTSSGTADARSLSFRGDKSITVGISASEVVFSVGAYITTGMASNRGSDFVQATAAFAGTSASGTIASNGISVSIGPYITTADLSANSSKYVQNWKLTGNTAGTTSSAQGTDLWFSGGNSITVSGSSNTVVFSVGAYITTADLSANSSKYAQNWKLTSNTAGTTSSAFGTDLWLAGGQGITLSGSSNSITFSVGSYITTGALSNHSHGFSAGAASSTFQTLSFQDSNNFSFSNNAGQIRANHNLAGTSTGFAGANISGSITHDSSGINLSLSVAAPGAAAITQSIGMSTQTAGGGTGGTTGYATGDDILYHFVAGSNITLSQSLNGASGTLSIYGTSGGGGAATIAGFNNLVPGGDTGNEPRRSFGITNVAGTIHVYPLVLAPFAGPFPGDLTCNTFYLRMSLSGSTATMSQSQTSSFFIGIYTRNASTLSLLNSASTSFGSGAAATNISSIYAGNRYLTIGTAAWSSSPVFRAGSEYYIATMHRTSNVSNQSATFYGAGYIWASNSQSHSGTIGVASANATTMGILPWVGQYSVTSAAMPASIGSAELNKQVNNVVVPLVFLNQDYPASF